MLCNGAPSLRTAHHPNNIAGPITMTRKLTCFDT
jgi:hypothetical protein